MVSMPKIRHQHYEHHMKGHTFLGSVFGGIILINYQAHDEVVILEHGCCHDGMSVCHCTLARTSSVWKYW